jgi:leader peptidase (prepilin peptidase) / N-methyltransferase
LILPLWFWIVGGGLLGAILGSFIGALCSRWPAGRSVMMGRSQCDGCGKILGVAELIPILSFLWQRGRCKQCNAAVDSMQLIAEISAAAIGGLGFVFLEPTQAIYFVIMGWLLLPLIILDYRYLWLPNLLILLLALAGPIAGYFLNPDYDIWRQILTAIIAFAALEALRRGFRWLRGREGMGAGDPKLFAAIALWIAPLLLPYILLIASLLGLIAILLLPKDIDKLTYKLPLGMMFGIAAIIVQFVQIRF